VIASLPSARKECALVQPQGLAAAPAVAYRVWFSAVTASYQRGLPLSEKTIAAASEGRTLPTQLKLQVQHQGGELSL